MHQPPYSKYSSYRGLLTILNSRINRIYEIMSYEFSMFVTNIKVKTQSVILTVLSVLKRVVTYTIQTHIKNTF